MVLPRLPGLNDVSLHMYVKRPPASFPQVGEDRGVLGRGLAGEGLKGLHGDNPRGDLGGLMRDRRMGQKHSAALSELTHAIT